MVTTSVERTTEETTTTESGRNSSLFSTITSSSNFTEFWQNKSTHSTIPIIEVPSTTPNSFTDKWTFTELSKSSSTEMESSTFTFANISSPVKPIFDESTVSSEHEQFLTKDEIPTTVKTPITPECHGILCTNSTILPTRNDSDASIKYLYFYLNFVLLD